MKLLTKSVLCLIGSTALINTAKADIVHADDVIVQFSQCVGNDCVNGENFGFDTQRLKENNLRIHFDDTSNSASFPSNDWRLVANDTSNGGASYFAIQDATAGRNAFMVEAGAPSNALVVESDGDVGIKTLNPVVDLHIVEGNTPTVRLEQDGSDGFTPQTWDVAGNEANFFIRDVTNGSRLSFRIRPGAPESSIDIASNGNVGIGTSSPAGKLHVTGSAPFADPTPILATVNGTEFRIMSELKNANASAGGIAYRMTNGDLSIDTNNTGGEYRINFADGDNQELSLDTDGNLTIDGTITTATQTLPDYVFEKDYPLMSLEELKSFIEKEKHLPGIPSANQVLGVQGGSYDMTKMQISLLEKVEELTLHTISQQERIEELQSMIDSLREK